MSLEQPSDRVKERLAELDEKLARLRELDDLVAAGRPGPERARPEPAHLGHGASAASDSGLARLRSRIARTDARRASRSSA